MTKKKTEPIITTHVPESEIEQMIVDSKEKYPEAIVNAQMRLDGLWELRVIL